jgi:hypothetical protein
MCFGLYLTLAYIINYGTDGKSKLSTVFDAFRVEIVDVMMQK